MEILKQTQPDQTPPPQGVECTICLSNEAKEVGLLKCQHTFCFECIESWSEHENSCPLCKVRFNFIDKVSKEALQTLADGKRKRINKERVKIKRKNQGDYEPAFNHYDGVDVWAQFIAGLVGAGNQHLRRFQRGDIPFPIFGAGYDEEAPRRRRVVPAARVIRPTRRVPTVGETANNPIALLSDDEGEGEGQNSQGQNSSSARPAPVVVDLTEDGDDVPWGPALASTSAAATSSTRATTTTAPLGATANWVRAGAVSGVATQRGGGDQRGAHFQQQVFFDSEEEDEDYDPEAGLGISQSDRDSDDSNVDLEEADRDLLAYLEEETGDDRSERSAAEVIELSDSERNEVRVPSVGAPSQRLSGVMVWCRDCDTFHDKQRVRDDRSYCPATYDALMQSDGLAFTPVPETQEGSDENEPWLESRNQQYDTSEGKLPLERTQSDATTSSSRSSSSSTRSAVHALEASQEEHSAKMMRTQDSLTTNDGQ